MQTCDAAQPAVIAPALEEGAKFAQQQSRINAAHTGCKRQIYLPGSKFNKTLARSQNLQQRAEASAIREFKPNRSTHSIPCKCACAAWVPVRATQRPAPQGWPRGDGDGPLADGRAPGECRAHGRVDAVTGKGKHPHGCSMHNTLYDAYLPYTTTCRANMRHRACRMYGGAPI